LSKRYIPQLRTLHQNHAPRNSKQEKRWVRHFPSPFRSPAPRPVTQKGRTRPLRHRRAPLEPGSLGLVMAEVGRVAVSDPGSRLLPGGFWAAVAVWVERPQVANKRLCGVRLEARRSVSLPQIGHTHPGPSAGPEPERLAEAGGCGPDAGPGPVCRSLDAGPGPGPTASPDQGRQEAQGRRQPEEEPGEAAAAAATQLSGTPGQPGKAAAREGDLPAADLGALWDVFAQSLAGDNREVLAFLTRSGAESPPEGRRELDLVLRTVIPKTNLHCPLRGPRREMVLQGTKSVFPIVAICQEIPHRGRHKLRWQGWVLIGDRMSGAGVGNGNVLSRILAWESPWTEESGGLYSPWGSQRVRHRLSN